MTIDQTRASPVDFGTDICIGRFIRCVRIIGRSLAAPSSPPATQGAEYSSGFGTFYFLTIRR